MPLQSLLIANRGEIAIRIARAAAELGIAHRRGLLRGRCRRRCTRARPTRPWRCAGTGPAAYLDGDADHRGGARTPAATRSIPATASSPRTPASRARCARGRPHLRRAAPGDRSTCSATRPRRARCAERCGVPVLPGTSRPDRRSTQARAFLASLGAGRRDDGQGGRRRRRPRHAPGDARPDELAEAFARCASEAQAAFGNGDLYVERLFPRARHIEVQIVGDGTGAVSASVGARVQPAAPAPEAGRDRAGAEPRRRRCASALLRGGADAGRGRALPRALGTVRVPGRRDASRRAAIAFIEANPRLQVEHTVTEEVTGVDLVRLQLRARRRRGAGRARPDAGAMPAPRGMRDAGRASTWRRWRADGSAAAGRRHAHRLRAAERPGRARRRLRLCRLPHQPALRLAAGQGDRPRRPAASPTRRAPRPIARWRSSASRARRPTSAFLQSLLRHPAVLAGGIAHRASSTSTSASWSRPATHRRAVFRRRSRGGRRARRRPGRRRRSAGGARATARRESRQRPPPRRRADGGRRPARRARCRCARRCRARSSARASPKASTVRAGQAGAGHGSDEDGARRSPPPVGGIVRAGRRRGGRHGVRGPAAGLHRGRAELRRRRVDGGGDRPRPRSAPTSPRCWRARPRRSTPAGPTAVARRRKTGQRTARENIDDLCDPGSFVEYGALVLAGAPAAHADARS